ncbi:DUF1801 domain-containing protein [Christiangramia aquimixticola]|uniref:DUF1801 domain-containing protein n=1 Tax=Christiangramia aquimixticola TaxID=1697558 RepID=UPI003AA9B890
MKIEASSPAEYISHAPSERHDALNKLRQLIRDNIPEGFEETLSYGMIGYVVPHSVYPPGYHCTPELPLPYMNLASQKNFIGVYHSGIYADKDLHDWFSSEYKKRVGKKADMGKSCIRLKKLDEIPFELIGELAAKISAKEWIELYEKNIRKE